MFRFCTHHEALESSSPLPYKHNYERIHCYIEQHSTNQKLTRDDLPVLLPLLVCLISNCFVCMCATIANFHSFAAAFNIYALMLLCSRQIYIIQ